mmetsp:Transcript_43455/g.120237  ORF Transcript_43455/g.120237 Transcript_43455/m.120237 type:complete len:254 (-) Transcript_43455:151-912(-)
MLEQWRSVRALHGFFLRLLGLGHVWVGFFAAAPYTLFVRGGALRRALASSAVTTGMAANPADANARAPVGTAGTAVVSASASAPRTAGASNFRCLSVTATGSSARFRAAFARVSAAFCFSAVATSAGTSATIPRPTVTCIHWISLGAWALHDLQDAVDAVVDLDSLCRRGRVGGTCHLLGSAVGRTGGVRSRRRGFLPGGVHPDWLHWSSGKEQSRPPDTKHAMRTRLTHETFPRRETRRGLQEGGAAGSTRG